MKYILLIAAVTIVAVTSLWLVRNYQVDDGRSRLIQKINLAMEGENTICARKVDDYAWQDVPISGGPAQTFGPTLVLYSFKKVSDEEFLFKKILVRGTKQLPHNAAVHELNKCEPIAMREMPPCTNRNSSLEFLNYTLGRNAEVTLISRYWMLTSLKSDEPGAVANYKSSLGTITSNGHIDALMSSETIVYRIAKRQKDYSSYFTDLFASKSPLLDN